MRVFKNKRLLLHFLIILSFLATTFFINAVHHTPSLLEVTQEDPLFYSPEIDTTALKKRVLYLQEIDVLTRKVLTERVVKNDLNNTNAELGILRKIANSEIVPVSYLISLPAAIENTDRFLENPTVFRALIMLISDYRSAIRYRNATKQWRNLVLESTALDSSEGFRIRFLASETNRDVLENDASLLYQNGEHLVTEARGRVFCLILGSCEALGRDIQPTVTSPLSSHDVLPDTIIDIGYENLERAGPFVIEQSCFPERNLPFYLYSGNGHFIPKQANEGYYWDFSNENQDSQSPYVRNAFERGILYDNQPEGTNYRCPDLQYWTELALLNYFHKEDYGVTSSVDLASLARQLRDNTDELSQTHLLILENRLIELPNMISTIGDYLQVYATLLESYWNSAHPLYLLGVRSSYSLLFNTYSRSIWRMNEKPLYISEGNMPLSDSYTTYHELLNEYTPDEIRAFHEKVKLKKLDLD